MMRVSEASPATVASNVRRLEEGGEVVTSTSCRLPPDRLVLNTYGIVMHTACLKARYGVLRIHSQITSCALSAAGGGAYLPLRLHGRKEAQRAAAIVEAARSPWTQVSRQ
jgi:hypothetical protein